MNFEPSVVSLLVVGIVSGVAAGLFGIGGGLIIIPALIYFLGFSQHKATGTSLAVLLPPVGLAAVLEFYRHGNVDVRAAIFIAIGLIVGAWAGAYLANKVSGPYLRLAFGIFVLSTGVYLIVGALKRLNWI